MIVRHVLERDEQAVEAVVEAAFRNHPHSEGTEPAIVAALREAGDLQLSLVAEMDHVIVGHAAWSEAILANGERGWFALGPIGVAPDRKRIGVGRALIEAGAAVLRERGAKGVVLLGDPAYYAQHGFRRDTPLFIEGPLAQYFQVAPFTRVIPATEVSFAPAFRQVQPRNR